MGGNLGLIPRKYALEEPLSSVAFKLTPGQISDVIETEFGIHILRVNERKEGKPSEFAKIKDDVREFCNEEFFQDTLARQRKTAKIEVFLP
jgi:peptidyl-prolyl cis-trans isomerase C